MTLTLLIDLDDTLISNDVDVFLKGYFSSLGNTLQPWVPPSKMMEAMMAATRGMIEKKAPALTMEEQFDRVFYPMLGLEKKTLKIVIDRFYSEKFPELRELTSPQPEAIRLIEEVIQRGWNIIVATNPLFPLTAIEQRLDWAGLAPARTSFGHITSYETSHFCKPHTAYYAEILGKLTWPQHPVVMVGNSLEDDIIPADKIGLPTYWLIDDGMDDGRGPLSTSGALDGVLPWLEKIDIEQPKIDLQCHEATMATLQSTPAVLEQMSRLLPQESWSFRTGKSEWNLVEILAHMRDVDREVNMGRIQSTIRGDNPFLPGANTDIWVQERGYASEEGTAALNGFIQSRTHLLELLDGATDEDLSQPARHAIFGPTTLSELLGFIATHDRTHIRQAYNTVYPGK